MPDIDFTHHGSLVLIAALTPDGQEWLDLNVITNEETQTWCNAIVAEPRFAETIAIAAHEDGLTVEF